MYLGIDTESEMVLEGSSIHGARFLQPSPLLTPAKFVTSSEQHITPASVAAFGRTSLLFREDAFDPVTRIRRGRFYKQSPQQPQDWSGVIGDSWQKYRAITYQSCLSSDVVLLSGSDQQIVILGSEDAFSLWSVFNRELIYSNELVFTLKARQSFGALPVIDWNVVPDTSGLVREKLECLIDDVFRASPESVVDRAREAATAVLGSYLQSEGVTEAIGKDLGSLIKLLVTKYGENSKRILACAAEIPQRLHSRGKHAEQEKRDNLRPIREQDAELAVQCIGVMLCDLGWGKWP